MIFFSRPGSHGLLYKHRHNSLINSISHPCPPMDLQQRHAQTVRDSSSSYKIPYVVLVWDILNLKGHQNQIGSKVLAIFLNGLVLPVFRI